MAKQVSGVFESFVVQLRSSAQLIIFFCVGRLSRLPKT